MRIMRDIRSIGSISQESVRQERDLASDDTDSDIKEAAKGWQKE